MIQDLNIVAPFFNEKESVSPLVAVGPVLKETASGTVDFALPLRENRIDQMINRSQSWLMALFLIGTFAMSIEL